MFLWENNIITWYKAEKRLFFTEYCPLNPPLSIRWQSSLLKKTSTGSLSFTEICCSMQATSRDCDLKQRAHLEGMFPCTLCNRNSIQIPSEYMVCEISFRTELKNIPDVVLREKCNWSLKTKAMHMLLWWQELFFFFFLFPKDCFYVSAEWQMMQQR